MIELLFLPHYTRFVLREKDERFTLAMDLTFLLYVSLELLVISHWEFFPPRLVDLENKKKFDASTGSI